MGNTSEANGDGRRRLALVSRIYRPESSAASLRLGALVDALRAADHEVSVLTTRPPVGAYDLPRFEPGVSRWPVLRDRSGYVRGYLPYLSFDLPLLLRVLFGRSVDGYVCEPPPTTGAALRIAAAIRRTPYVYYAADIWSDAAAATTASSLVLRVLGALERYAMRGASRVLAVTDGVRARVGELAPGVAVDVVGHGVDLSRFAGTGAAVTEPADIVYVGSASEWHGAEIAIEALAHVMSGDTTSIAAFIGQGTSWEGMQEDVRRRGLSERIRFFDTVPPEEAAAWLRGARISLATLVPGKGYDFAVPTKLYASIAVGTPVVYAGPPAIAEVISRNGLGAVSPYESDSFAQAIRNALADADGEPDTGLILWAKDNLSSAEVAQRSMRAIVAATRRRKPGRRM